MAVLKLNNLKQRNLSAVLRCFCENDRLSRRDVAAMLGCDHATVTRAVRDLQTAGLLAPAGKCVLAHGRPREMMTLHPDSPRMLGVELLPGQVRGAVISLRGVILDRCQTGFSSDGTRKGFCDALKECVTTLAAKHRGIAGCGLATIGSLDNERGIIAGSANLPELSGFDAAAFWQENFALPLPQLTDRMPAEIYWFIAHNPALRQGTFMVVDAGVGIGMALARNGVLLDPARCLGGELGHNTVFPAGELCRCGRRGCLEAYASTGVLFRKSRCRTMAEAVSDPQGRVTVEDAAGLFGLVLANQINNLIPDHVVITGELLNGGSVVTGKIREILQQQLFPAAKKSLHVSFLPGGADAAGGVALLAREEFFRRMEKNEGDITPPLSGTSDQS